MNDIVSIIIPVYNVEKYLERCIESVLRQTYTNLQIILVNDGSQDSSGQICDAYAAKYPQIEVIHQANGGLSAARNAGLECATGEWIVFIDSDDYISAHYVKQMLDICILHDADISICKVIFDNDGNLNENNFKKSDKFELITGREAVLRHFGKVGKDAPLFYLPWNKLMRASLWKDLRFPVGKINEDIFVSHNFLYSARNVVIVDAYLYAYFQSPISIMRSPFTLARLDILDSWYEGVRFFTQVAEPEFANIAHRIYLSRLFDAYGLCGKYLPDERDIRKSLRRKAVETYNTMKRINSYIDVTQKQVFLYRVKWFVGRYFPAIYYVLFLRNKTLI